jgi:hypothetical protein
LAEKTPQPEQITPRTIKRGYFVDNGGAGMFIALSGINSDNLSQNDLWMLNYIKGALEDIFKKYSNIIVLDHSKDGLARIQEEMEFQMSGLVADENVVSIGKFHGANYIIVGTITKINVSEYSIQLRIINIETAVQNANSILICPIEQIRDATALRKLSYDLLTQIGVDFTENGRKAILENL